jgi:hypothetical protein
MLPCPTVQTSCTSCSRGRAAWSRRGPRADPCLVSSRLGRASARLLWRGDLPRADTQHDPWAGVLCALLLVESLLGGRRILSLTGTLAHRRQPSAVRREGSALAWGRRHGAQVPGSYRTAAALPGGVARGLATNSSRLGRVRGHAAGY